MIKGAHQCVTELQSRGAQICSIGNFPGPQSEDCAFFNGTPRGSIWSLEEIKIVQNNIIEVLQLALHIDVKVFAAIFSMAAFLYSRCSVF